jgi:streptomycin 6-kinase
VKSQVTDTAAHRSLTERLVICRQNHRVAAANRLETCARRWSLQVGERLVGGFRSDVYAVVRPDGTHGVLKLCGTVAEAREEAAALRLWTGSGASVELLALDHQLGALLLERLWPGSPMPRGEVGTAQVAASMFSALHAGQAVGFAFRSVVGSFPSHERQARDDLAYFRRTRHEPRRAMAAERVLPAAGVLMKRLAVNVNHMVLLHGDFLTKNLLRAGHDHRAIGTRFRGWVTRAPTSGCSPLINRPQSFSTSPQS